MSSVNNTYDFKRKLISVPVNSKLSELGGIQGPVLNPTWVLVDVIKKLLMNGRIVYEHSVLNKNRKVRLTLDNYLNFNLFPENTPDDPDTGDDTYLLRFTDIVPEQLMTAGYLYVKFYS